MLDDGHQGEAEAQAHPDYAEVPTASPRLVWYWRLRVAFGSTPLVALMLGDMPAAFLFLAGAAWLAAALFVAARLARIEARVRAMRAERERR